MTDQGPGRRRELKEWGSGTRKAATGLMWVWTAGMVVTVLVVVAAVVMIATL